MLRRRRSRGLHGGIPPQALAHVAGGDALSLAIRLRYWRQLAALWAAAMLLRFLAGRVMLRSRATDATYVHAARAVQGGWWASRAGWVRQSARLWPLAALIAWNAWSPVGTIVLTLAALSASLWWGVRRWRDWRHDRVWLDPVWPAIAQALGSVADGAPPRSWVELPADPRDNDAVIAIGLPPETGDDVPLVERLGTILDQRLGAGRWVPAIDHVGRVVEFSHRPPDPDVWAAMTPILGLDADALSANWLELPDDPAARSARIVVHLPAHMTNERARIEALTELVGARFPGEWTYRTALAQRLVTFVHKTRVPTPPRVVIADEVADLADMFGGLLPDPEGMETSLTGVDFDKAARGGEEPGREAA